MTKRHFSKCVDQVKKHFFPSVHLKELKKLARIDEKDITKGPVGVQVQLVNEDGEFEEDFVFEIFEGDGIQKRMIKSVFVPSPGATSCMAIAEYVAEEFFKECPKCDISHS
ncbi:unnamed protein product [Phaedon cochleariae]|uniref:Uncharacterized protein n=1 Tax=Phaedon cochleariae TaxID=80249 RepID=A0A9N9X2X4_PHACE|nr:unnamed protein product [Phaedon cochleariae]